MGQKTLILGLGNELFCDDAVGLYVVRELARLLDRERFEVIESPFTGLRLLELVEGYPRLVIIDAINLVGAEPGEVRRVDLNALRGANRIDSAHDVDLATALDMGRRLNLNMPDHVVAYGIQVEDPYTMKEGLSDTLQRALPDIVAHIAAELENADA